MQDIKTKTKTVTFKTPSHLYFEKGKIWFVVVFLILLIFAALFIYLRQYLSAVVFLVMGIVLSIYSQAPPKEVSCTISKEGVKFGERFYPYSSLKAFWIAKISPYPILYFESAHRFKPLFSISLGKEPPEPIKKILAEHLPERSERGEDIRDKIIKIFRL